MVKAWFMDNNPENPCTEHHKTPPEYVSLDDLFESTAVEYFYINPDDRSKLDIIRKERGYSYEDEINCSEGCLPNFEEKLKMFYQEHLHTDEEIRYVLEGSGYFDVRDRNDKWIRIQVNRGDLIIIPSGIYHRFTLDTTRFIRTKRYFVGEPVWVAHNRPADEMESRREYLQKLENKQFTQKIY
ncbi:acireductone dioxygenase [Atheta coriaria]|uniref:acireductone dioxygenase n=1 Tax=Dalotia coriaria TaxID=877792 RepID=UPI0031F39327